MTSNDLPDHHDNFGGLHRDLPLLVDRRRAMQWVGGVGLAAFLAACGSNDDPSTATTTSAAGSETTATDTPSTGSESPTETSTVEAGTVEAGAGVETPDETAGPFPADGSNGPNLLGEDGVVRPDLTSSVGTLSGTAEGIPAAFQLTIVDAATGSPLPGAAVYLWHCTAGGQYSLYEISDQNYLRGVQVADNAGKLTFTSVFPGCYPGRWPHCHFEIYDNLDSATAGNQAIKTSQLALPQADCEAIYADSRYGSSAGNLDQLSLSTDNVFRDGWEDQLATVAGDPGTGFTASLLIRV